MSSNRVIGKRIRMIHQHRLLHLAEGVEVGADGSDDVQREFLRVSPLLRRALGSWMASGLRTAALCS